MRWSSAFDTDHELASAVERAAERLRLGLGRQEPDLVIAFVSPHHAGRFAAFPELVRSEFENALLFGCCGGGVIGAGREVEDRPALSLTGAVLPGVNLKALHFEATQAPPPLAEARVWEDALRMTAIQQPSFLVLADPFSFETETFLRGLDRAFPMTTKVGGLASGAQQAGGSALFLGDQIHHSGCITLAMTGNIEIDTVVAQGCRPIGEPMFVTAAHDNLIRELDGRAPRQVIAQLFERLPSADRELLSHSLFLGLALRTDATQYLPGDFLIRNILGMDPQTGALWVNTPVEPNSVVQFHLRDAATSAEDLERSLTAYRTAHRLDAARGALLFSCLGRGQGLYGQSDHDSNAFRRLIADLPLGGFFCNGEIGPVQSRTYLHGYTSAFAIFRERK